MKENTYSQTFYIIIAFIFYYFTAIYLNYFIDVCKRKFMPPTQYDRNYRKRKWKETQYSIPRWRISNTFLYYVEYLINSITVSYSNKSYYCRDLWRLGRECNRNFQFSGTYRAIILKNPNTKYISAYIIINLSNTYMIL